MTHPGSNPNRGPSSKSSQYTLGPDGGFAYDPREPDPEAEAAALADPERPVSPYVSESDDWYADLDGIHGQISLDRVPPFECVLTEPLPWMRDTGFDLATARHSRLGGDHPADQRHQSELFLAVGMVTVMAGQIEAEMKRILLAAEAGAKASFPDVDQTWSDLHSALATVAQGGGELAQRLGPVLKWGEQQRITEHRHDVVHASWCLYDLGHFVASRFKRREPTGAMIVYTRDDLVKVTATMADYLDQLRSVTVWPTMVLPPLATGSSAAGTE